MKNWLRNLLHTPGSSNTPDPNPPAQEIPENQFAEKNELQTLRIEQAGNKRTIEHLTQEIDRLRNQQQEFIQLTLAKELEGLYKDMAAPASQLLTQTYLIENQGKALQAQDILAVSRRLVKAMERHGIVFEGQVGEKVFFDPGKHILIQPGKMGTPGQPVVIRFCGVSFAGNIIHKAIVEQEPACQED
jgi:molecular chaperone GrpE (heat shock protein)